MQLSVSMHERDIRYKRVLGNSGYIYKEAYWKNSRSVRHKKRQKSIFAYSFPMLSPV